MIKQVIFDFGGVIVEWLPENLLARLYPDKRDRDVIRSEVFKHPDWLEMDRGTLEDDGAIQRFVARTGRLPTEFHSLLHEVRLSLTPIPQSVALLEEISGRLPVFGLSNMSESNFAYLHGQHSFWKLFRGIVISARVKMIKPDAAIFEHICRSYDLQPRETVFIDDHPPNIASAEKLGFKVIRFESSRQCRDELLQLLS